MTAKSRARKIRKRLKEAQGVVKTQSYFFTTQTKYSIETVEVVAPSLEEARQKFIFTYGYEPTTPQEYLHP